MSNAAIDAAVFNLITQHIGKTMPTQRDIAGILETTVPRINHSFARLVASGEIETDGTGGMRVIHIPGVGSTLSRLAGKEVAAYRVVDDLPERIESYSCVRCGVRNCQRHSAAFLTTGRAPRFLGAC